MLILAKCSCQGFSRNAGSIYSNTLNGFNFFAQFNPCENMDFEFKLALETIVLESCNYTAKLLFHQSPAGTVTM